MTRKTLRLMVGTGAVDITPPVGVSMVGALTPRVSIGIDDPLMAKAIVLESGGTRVAVVVLDVAAMMKPHADACIQLASRRTGIPESHIFCAATHTHTGPIYTPDSYLGIDVRKEMAWLDALPEQFASAVEAADAAKQPARWSRMRGFCHGLGVSRRLRLKDGRELNLWNVPRTMEAVQSLGYASHADPEIGILCFDGEDGAPLAVLWHFACHTNANFGPRFSADYPAVVAQILKDRYPGVASIFLPGACGDVNPVMGWREIGDKLGREIVAQLESRTPSRKPPVLDAMKRTITVEARRFRPDEAERRRRSGWSKDLQKWFVASEKLLRQRGETRLSSVIQAWRIGDVGFASVPGELFVEWGFKLKAASPFPWTYPVELGGDCLGYLVTESAEKTGGYESLNAITSRTDFKGARRLVHAAGDCLVQLWEDHENRLSARRSL